MNEQETKNNRLLLFFIAALLVVLIGQTSFLIFHFIKKSSAVVQVSPKTDKELRESTPTRRTAQAILSPRAYYRQHHSAYSPSAQSFQEQDEALSDPWQMFEKMHERFNSLFNSTLASSSLLAPSFDFGTAFDFAPAIDLEERADAYILRGDLPGLEKDKIDVSVRGNIVTVQGVRESGNETKDEAHGYFAQERSYGSFARTVALPGPVDETKVAAQYENGVLTITLPKLQKQGDVSKKVAIA